MRVLDAYDVEATAFDLVYTYYIYKMVYQQFGADPTEIAPGLPSFLGEKRVATFYEFARHLITPGDQEIFRNSFERDIESHLGLLPDVFWVGETLFRNKRFPHIDIGRIHVDLTEMREQVPYRILPE